MPEQLRPQEEENNNAPLGEPLERTTRIPIDQLNVLEQQRLVGMVNRNINDELRVSAEVASPKKEPETDAQVPMMITHKMEEQLAGSGMTAEEINKLTPGDAWNIINSKKISAEQGILGINPDNIFPDKEIKFVVPEKPEILTRADIVKTPEQKIEKKGLEVATTPEENRKIVEDFENETKSIKDKKEELEKQIKQREDQKEVNEKMGHGSFNEQIDQDLLPLQEQREKLEDSLRERDFSYVGKKISGEIKQIDKKIENIKKSGSQDRPGLTPSSIIAERQKDVEELDAQKNEKIVELDYAKGKKIESYQKEKILAEKEVAEQQKEAIEKQAAQKAKEIEEQNKKEALAVLSDPKVMERSPKEIGEAFEKFTGEKLETKRNEMVEKSLGERKMIVVHKEQMEEYRQKMMKKEQERILMEEHSRAQNTLWERNPNVKVEDRDNYLNKVKKSLGLDANSNAVIDKLINDGYAVEKSKTGWFSSKIKIPRIEGKGTLVYADKKELSDQTSKDITFKTLNEAQIRTDLKIIEGRKRLVAERAIFTKVIIDQAVESYNLEAQQRIEEDQKAKEEVVKTTKKKMLVKPKKTIKRKMFFRKS